MTYTYIKTKQTVIATDENGNDTVFNISELPNLKRIASLQEANAKSRIDLIDAVIAFSTESVTPTA